MNDIENKSEELLYDINKLFVILPGINCYPIFNNDKSLFRIVFRLQPEEYKNMPDYRQKSEIFKDLYNTYYYQFYSACSKVGDFCYKKYTPLLAVLLAAKELFKYYINKQFLNINEIQEIENRLNNPNAEITTSVNVNIFDKINNLFTMAMKIRNDSKRNDIIDEINSLSILFSDEYSKALKYYNQEQVNELIEKYLNDIENLEAKIKKSMGLIRNKII